MKNTITMTSKGTFTLPVEIRKKIGVNKLGDKLNIEFNEKTNQVVITKPISIDDIQKYTAKYIKKSPLKNVDKFYQENKI